MRIVVGWLRGNCDAYFEVCDPERDLVYYVREVSRLLCRVEPSYTIIINDAR
jgi:hypothetical protein